MNTKQYAASSLLVALLITNTSPWIPLAMANPVVPNSSRLGPKMDVASNGISIVNINTPNDKGLSHNQYDTFSINNNGLILNNANRPVSTELAGYIMGNPNLVGPTAKTILNEVTGTNSTAMNGALEVAGNKAHVIIANPNGISISNGTFINTNAATLTTGKPIIDNGTISAYKINQGTIDIDSKGLNTSKTARTDILAEAIKVNGELWANDLQMVSGQNTVNVNSDGKVINVTKNNESSKIGLDVAKIGGMYANSIYLVGTNDGLGVNNKGIVSARDTLSLDVNGRVQNTGTIASSDAYIKSKSFDQLGEAKFYADNATFVVDSLSQNGNQATNKNPIILAQNSLSIAGQTLSNTNGSVIKTDGKLQIGRNISYDGVISGKIDNITNIGSTIEAGTGGKITAKEINNINGGVTLKRVQVGEVETIKDEVTVNDYPGEKFTIKDPKIYHLNELTDDIDQVVVEAENLQFYAKKDHKDDWVRYNYTRTKHKDVVDISKPARIISGGDLEVSADYVKNDSSQISSAGQLTSKIGKFEQTNPSSKEYIVEDGTAVSYSRHHHNGADSTNIDTAPYHKVTEFNTKLPLSVFKSNDLNSKTNIGQDSSLLNSISKISQNPNTSYIMETDPNFTNRRNFLSSDYVLNRLKLDPMNVQKRLGDGYYEQQLVMQEILRQTGKSRLQSGLTAEEQYRKLMDAGINLTKSQSIALGRELTVAEQNNLKEDVATEHHSLQERKKSIAKRESIDAIDNSHIETVSGSNIGGKTVNIKATNSIEGKSITILGEDNVELQSGGEVNIGADKHILDSNSSYHHKKSGLLGGAGIGFSIGKERINSDDSKHEEITARSTIASTKGNINIRSNDTLQLTSGNIVSKNGVYLSGSNVILDGNVDNTSASHNESYKKSGLTVSLGGAAINAVTDGTRTIKQAGSRNDKRLAALELNEARKQFQDGYYAVDEALKGEKIRNPETGKVEKVDGKDKRGTKNIDNAVNLSISIGSTSQHQNQSIDVHEYNGGTIISDGSVNIEANDATKSGVNLVGQDILAKEVNINSASDINLSAGKNTLQGKDNYKHSGWSVGASLSLTSGSLLGFDASGSLAKQNGVTDQVTYKPTSIRAVELAQLKAKRDTEIIGSKVSGKGVVVNTGNNLKIESLQSVDNFKEHSKSAGFSVSTSPKFKGTIGSVGGSVGRTDSKLKSVTDQAGIFAGDNGYNISTGNTTSLKGSLISSKADKAKNSLTTRHLDINDIQNKAEYTVRDNGVQYNNFGSSKTKSKKEFDKIYKHIGLTPTGGVGAHGKSSSITKSAISDGKIIENGRMVDIKTINTDIEHSLNELQAIFDKKSIEEKQQLAHLFSVNANEAIHQIAKHEGWKDGDPRKVALHAMVGGTTANLGGGQFSDGVYAAGLSEAMMPQFKKWAGKIKGPDGKEYVDPERLQQIAFVFGYATNEISGKSGQSGAYVSYMGAKHNFGYSPDEIKEKINEVTENLSELGNRWKQDRIKGEEERIYDELHPEPLPASPDENGEALVSAEKSGNYDTEEYKEAADYTYNRDGDVDTSPTSDNYGFTLANQGVQPTGVTEDGTTYYIENGKTYMGPKVKDLDGIPSNERSNNYGLWLETNGYKPTGTSNGHTYFRFYYELNNPNQLLPYNPNYQPTDTQGYVDYIGYQVDQERPKSLLDSKISSVIENEGEQYKPFATLIMSSSSYSEKANSRKVLDDQFKNIVEGLPEYKNINTDNANELKERNIELSGYDPSKKEVYYDLKQKDGTIKRTYAGKPENYKAFSENDLDSKTRDTMINNTEARSKLWLKSKLDEYKLPLSLETKNSISDKFGALMREGMDTALKPVDLGVYVNKVRGKYHDNSIIYDEFDSYEANKLLTIKLAADTYFYKKNSPKYEPVQKDFVITTTNAGLGETYDIVSTNTYNLLVDPLKTVDQKTEADREKDREFYIKNAE